MTSLFDQMFSQQPQPMNMNGPVLTDPSTISSNIQQWLGAKPQVDTTGQVPSILAGRFEPSLEDAGNSALSSLNSGKYVSSQSVADNRASESLKNLEALTKAQFMAKGGGSGSVFAQTMEAINNDPSLASLSMMDKIRLAQNKLGTNLTMGADGKVADMNGAAQGLGNLAYGEKKGGELGTKQVQLQYNPLIAGGEADMRNASDIRAAAPRAIQTKEGEAMGGAITNLPKIEQDVDYSKNLLAGLVSHPALADSTGLMSMLPTVPGSQRADFKSRLSQVNGQAFLQAFAGLRGGGSISNAEGEAATQAITRLSTATNQKDFTTAANELSQLLDAGLSRQRATASGQFTINNGVNPNVGDPSFMGQSLTQSPAMQMQGSALPQINQAQPKLAPDGHQYLPDPNRPGKYLRVD